MTALTDLSEDPRTLHVVKRPLRVQVRFAPVDGICETLEGKVAFRSGDAILTGGEPYGTGVKFFSLSHIFSRPSLIIRLDVN